MCGRYNIIPDAQAWAAAFQLTVQSQNKVKSLSANYNVTPSSQVSIVRSIAQEYTLSDAHWGLIPFWAKDKKIAYKMINARAETICQKPAFKNAFRRNRCLVVANGFYEWQKQDGQKTKQPYLIKNKGSKRICVCWNMGYLDRPEKCNGDSFLSNLND